MAEETTTTTATETPEIDYQAECQRMQAERQQMQAEIEKLKSSNDRFSSELAERKRKEREQMSAEAQREAEQAEREEHYRELERRIALRDYADQLTFITDGKAKQEIAELLADGKIAEALKKQSEIYAADRKELERQIRAELMQYNPQSTPQGTSGVKTKADILAITDPVERQKAIAENMQLFI